MTKITKSGKQLKINIPKDIADVKGWDEDTELIFTPFLKEPDEEITGNSAIILKELSEK